MRLCRCADNQEEIIRPECSSTERGLRRPDTTAQRSPRQFLCQSLSILQALDYAQERLRFCVLQQVVDILHRVVKRHIAIAVITETRAPAIAKDEVAFTWKCFRCLKADEVN